MTNFVGYNVGRYLSVPLLSSEAHSDEANRMWEQLVSLGYAIRVPFNQTNDVSIQYPNHSYWTRYSIDYEKSKSALRTVPGLIYD